MGGVNPATKAVKKYSEPETEETVDDLLEKYEEVKNGTRCSLSPHEVKEHLPEKACIKEGKLRVEASTRDDDYANLTPMRKEILRALNRGLSTEEIVNRDIASSSYVSRTRREFDFLLENPALYSAFVEKGRVKDNWRIVDPKTDTELTYDSRRKAVQGLHKFIQSFGTTPEVYHNDECVSSIEHNGKSVSLETDDNEIESFAEGIENPLDDEDWQNIVAALHRDNQDELASFVIGHFL